MDIPLEDLEIIREAVKNLTDEEMFTIEEVVNRLAPSFKFGYYDVEDIKQEAMIIAFKSLKKYDKSRPLKNFLYIHLRHRLKNLIRDKYSRHETPCQKCEFYDKNLQGSKNQCLAFENKMDCNKWKLYTIRNQSKENIIQPMDINSVSDTEKNIYNEPDIDWEIEKRDALNKLDMEIPQELRSDYLKMKSGINISKTKREKLMSVMAEILNGKEKQSE